MVAGCIVHCNKVSKPVKGKYLLLCMNSIMYLLLTSYTIQYNTIICNAHKVEYRTSNLRQARAVAGRARVSCGRWLAGMRCEECF